MYCLKQRFNNPANDKLSHAKERVDDVKGIMIDNIGTYSANVLNLLLQCPFTNPTIVNNLAKIMERGEQLDILVEQSANLTSDAADFKYEADDLRQRMCRQHARLIIILSIVGAVSCWLHIVSEFSHLCNNPSFVIYAIDHTNCHAQVVLLIVIIAIIVGVCTQIPGACSPPKKKLLRF